MFSTVGVAPIEVRGQGPECDLKHEYQQEDHGKWPSVLDVPRYCEKQGEHQHDQQDRANPEASNTIDRSI